MKILRTAVVAVVTSLLVILTAGAQSAHAQTCPPGAKDRYYAAVQSPITDYAIAQADDFIEIADPWLNTCTDGRYKKWASQVMWLVDTSNGRFAEIGWRRECDGLNVNDYMYYGYGTYPNGFPRKIVDTSQLVVVPHPGERYAVRIWKVGAGEQNQNLWRFQVQLPGSAPVETKSISISSDFAPDRIDVGGENLYDHHDMGVSGHLEAEYRLSNGSLLFLNDQTVARADSRPRYSIVKGTGGYGGSRYFQTQTNIHQCNPCPSAVPVGTEMCP